MSASDDDIPVLTSVVRRAARAPGADELAELEVRLTTASLDLADRLIHSAFREMEAAMFEQVSNRLRAELPGIVAGILAEHFDRTDDDSND